IATDDDATNWNKIFTLLSRSEIQALIEEHDQSLHQRHVHKALHRHITIRTHSQENYQMAIKTSEFLFGSGGLEFLNELNDQQVLEVFDGVPQFTISRDKLASGVNILDLLAIDTNVFASKGEARKMLQGGGVSMNRQKLNDIEQQVNTENLINEKYLVLQRGKKNYFLISVS